MLTLVILVFVVVFGCIIFSYIYRRTESFEGVVVDKDVRENINNTMPNRSGGITLGATNGGNVTHQYMLKVKTDAGKTIHYQVSEGKYQLINIGDRVSKRSGTTDVEVTQKATGGQSQPPASGGTPLTGSPPTAITN